MNTNAIASTYRRKVVIACLAMALAITMLAGQTPLGNLLGMELTPAAYACEHSGGAGC
ncbi:MAG: hypothetical protein KF832_11740 [Caldilineaceae bacterium]|nr:hypothetical protein [Caldilineaceae bacterium]